MAFNVTTVTSDKGWAPDTNFFSPVDVVPDALINTCSTMAGSIEGDEPAVHVAFVDDDEAVFKAEAEELDEAEPALSEVLIHTAKLTQLIRISSEQFVQSSTASQLSQSVARAITRRANLAFVAEQAPIGPNVAPVAGLVNTPNLVEGDTISASLDELVNLIAHLQANLAVPSHILVDPFGWSELRKLKVGTAYNQSLLGAGTSDAKQMLLGLPVIVDPAVPEYTGVVLDRNAIVSAVGQIKVSTSPHQFFTSDSVVLRATWRFGHVVVRPERLGVFTITGTGS